MFSSIIFGVFIASEVVHSLGAQKSSKDSIGVSGKDGKKIPKSNPIINGERAGDHEFPFYVALKKLENPGNIVAGARSIISRSKSSGSEWVLTARHLVVTIDEKVPAIKFRELIAFPNYDNKWQNLIKYPHYNIVQTYCHPWPKSQEFPIDDIALLELDSKIELEKPPHNFKSIPLVDKNFDVNKQDRVKIAGWGLNQTEPQPKMIPDYLMKAEPKVIHPRFCAIFYKEFTAREKFCAGENVAGVMTTTCNGDSGSPVTINKPGTGDIQVGLVEGGNQACT